MDSKWQLRAVDECSLSHLMSGYAEMAGSASVRQQKSPQTAIRRSVWQPLSELMTSADLQVRTNTCITSLSSLHMSCFSVRLSLSIKNGTNKHASRCHLKHFPFNYQQMHSNQWCIFDSNMHVIKQKFACIQYLTVRMFVRLGVSDLCPPARMKNSVLGSVCLSFSWPLAFIHLIIHFPEDPSASVLRHAGPAGIHPSGLWSGGQT